MAQNQSKDIRLEIVFDHDDFEFTHIMTTASVQLSTLDFPSLLQQQLRRRFMVLFTAKIKNVHINLARQPILFLNNQPCDQGDLESLGGEEAIRSFATSMHWWISFIHRQSICRKDAFGRRPHTEWTCECGNKVSSELVLCPNQMCSSHKAYRACTGGAPKPEMFQLEALSSESVAEQPAKPQKKNKKGNKKPPLRAVS